MGYFDSLTATSFKEREDGSVIFYPWGILGDGYVLSTPQKQKQVRSFMNRFVQMAIPTGVLAGVFLPSFLRETIGLGAGVAVLAGVLAFALLFYSVCIRRLLDGVERAGERMSLRESLQRQANAQSMILLWMFEAMSLAFVVGGMWMAASGEKLVLGIACIAFFGVGAVMIAYQLKLKGAKRTD